ncbi:MAG: Uncharacterised protein [Halieaceae bacterium]|nr:MAG: Uncharacterised protein [Halieaceae bacterium]
MVRAQRVMRDSASPSERLFNTPCALLLIESLVATLSSPMPGNKESVSSALIWPCVKSMAALMRLATLSKLLRVTLNVVDPISNGTSVLSPSVASKLGMALSSCCSDAALRRGSKRVCSTHRSAQFSRHISSRSKYPRPDSSVTLVTLISAASTLISLTIN